MSNDFRTITELSHRNATSYFAYVCNKSCHARNEPTECIWFTRSHWCNAEYYATLLLTASCFTLIRFWYGAPYHICDMGSRCKSFLYPKPITSFTVHIFMLWPEAALLSFSATPWRSQTRKPENITSLRAPSLSPPPISTVCNNRNRSLDVCHVLFVSWMGCYQISEESFDFWTKDMNDFLWIFCQPNHEKSV